MEERLYAKPILHPGGSGDPAMAEGAKYTCENCGNILRVVSEFVCRECGAKILWDEKLLRSFDKYEDWLATPAIKRQAERSVKRMDKIERIEEERFVESLISLWIQPDAPEWIIDYVRTELRKQRGLLEEKVEHENRT